MGPHTPHRNDEGFSFVQMIVTMVIGGILLTTVGFAAFSYIQQARETVLESNIRTAAEAVRNTLALNPRLSEEDDADGKTRGAASARLISELSNAAGFAWQTPKAAVTGVEDGWLLPPSNTGDITPDVVYIQMINKSAGATASARATAAAGVTATSGSPAVAPVVRWLVEDRDAVRLQVQNEDGSWACALVVLRPDWNVDMAGTSGSPAVGPGSEEQADVEGKLRGIWYDAGGNIKLQGLHHCSPSSVGDHDVTDATTADTYGNTEAKDTLAATASDPLPVSGAEWNIPADGTTVDARTLLRAVPDFDAS